MQPTTINMNKAVNDQEVIKFNVDTDGLYVITVVARCKNWFQNAKRLFNDDDLAVQIDDYFFGELGGKKREFNVIGSWNGNELKNNSQAVIFLIPLKVGEHKITFWTNQSPFVETIDVAPVGFGAKELNIPVPVAVSAVDLVFKNAVPERIITGQGGAARLLSPGKSWSSDIHLVQAVRPGEPPVNSIEVTLADISVIYKIGQVKLYEDITTRPTVNLRAKPTTDSESLTDLPDGAKVEILDDRVAGQYVEDKSDIWHQVRYDGKTGFVLSSFVEIQGQERGKIIDLIKAKCIEPGVQVDPNILLAIAGQESRFKPYAVSSRQAKGVFQLAGLAAEQMHLADPFDFYKNIDSGVKYYKWIEDWVTGRGNILEKRLVAWHSGLGSVPKRGPVDYSTLRHPVEAKQFVTKVLENIKKKNWRRLATVVLVILAAGAGFLGGQIEQIHEVFGSEPTDFFIPTRAKQAAAIFGYNAAEGNQFIFQSEGNDEPKIVMVKGVRRADDDFQTVFYFGNESGGWRENLSGYFVKAGWTNLDYADNRIFWIERSEGHHLPTAFFIRDKFGDFQRIRFIGRDGGKRDEISAPFDILSANGESVLREWVDSAPNNGAVTRVREYKYEFRENIFRETNIVKRVLPSS